MSPDICLALIPWACLPGTVWLLRLRGRGFFPSVVGGSLVWSLLIWLQVYILSLTNLIYPRWILSFWILYVLVLGAFLLRRIRHWHLAHFEAWWAIPGAIAAITLLLGIVYPPNNYDSLTYHLPRIAHWLQNHTLSPWPTSIDRQIGMAPWNAMLMLQSYAIGHNDYFVNLGQWLAYLGSLFAVDSLTGLLGGGKRARMAAVIFFATLPVAILQCSNSDSCLIVTFYLLTMTWAFMEWRKSRQRQFILVFGLSLGFAILSKGSAYPIALPFVLVIAYNCLRAPRKLIWQGFAGALIIIAINFPHLAGNFAGGGNLVVSAERNIMTRPTPGTFLVNLVYNFISNEPEILGIGGKPILKKYAALLGVEQDDTSRLPWGGLEAMPSRNVPAEGNVSNPVHILVLFLILFHLGKMKEHKDYILVLAASCFFFCLLLTWHPWMTRIQIPLFALASPLLGLALMDVARTAYRKITICALVLTAVVPLLLCVERPLLPAALTNFYRHGVRHFLGTPREQLIFNYNPAAYAEYAEGVELLAAEKPAKINLQLGNNAPEYPLWAMLKNRDAVLPTIVYAPASAGSYTFQYIRNDEERQRPLQIIRHGVDSSQILFPQRP